MCSVIKHAYRSVHIREENYMSMIIAEHRAQQFCEKEIQSEAFSESAQSCKRGNNMSVSKKIFTSLYFTLTGRGFYPK